MSALLTWEKRTSDPITEGCEPPCPWKSSRWCSLLLSRLSSPAIATFWRLLGYQVISFQGWKRERIFSFFLNFNCNFFLTLCMYCVCMWCVLQTHSCNHMHVKVKEQLLGMGSLLSLWLPRIKLSVFFPLGHRPACAFFLLFIYTLYSREMDHANKERKSSFSTP